MAQANFFHLRLNQTGEDGMWPGGTPGHSNFTLRETLRARDTEEFELELSRPRTGGTRRQAMRRNWLVVILLAGLLPLAGCGGSMGSPFTDGVVNAQGPFTNASLQGPYAFSFSGVESPGSHIVAVGRLVLDGNGNITSGSERRTEDGFEFQFNVTGTYSVNPDGTGRLTMRFDGSVDTWSIVLSAQGQRVRMANIEPNNFLNGALLGEMEKQ
jgi:hypothetical protein